MNRFRFLMRSLGTIAVVVLGIAGSTPAQERYFPELAFLPDDKEANAIPDEINSVHLKAMEEPSLWKLSRVDRKAVIYRFTWRASGEHPISLRLTRAGETFTLHVAGHDGPPGNTAGHLTLNKDIKLSGQRGEQLIALLGRTPFWTAPAEVKESLGIADGDVLLMEGVKEGNYHVIYRAGSAAGESYKAFCRSLLELADEPAVLGAWDRFRRNERKSPRYRPEPPQTEYRGDPNPGADRP